MKPEAKTNGHEMAYPRSYEERTNQYAEYPPVMLQSEGGLTKREYFAAMALQGLLAKSQHSIKVTAQRAVEHADMLLDELEEKK